MFIIGYRTPDGPQTLQFTTAGHIKISSPSRENGRDNTVKTIVDLPLDPKNAREFAAELLEFADREVKR